MLHAECGSGKETWVCVSITPGIGKLEAGLSVSVYQGWRSKRDLSAGMY